MTHDELMAEACRLASETVRKGWGGPFGAVLVRDGEIIARGQNRVLITGDVTAHAEVEMLRKASTVLNPNAPTIAQEQRPDGHLALVPRPEGSPDVVEARARMFMGTEVYTSGIPCPMCMGALYWARVDAIYFANDLDATRGVGFDDQFQYEDFARPLPERRVKIEQLRPDLGAALYEEYVASPERYAY
jgi:tRNA(Arg) A34 adenosine deaminase TadA